MKKYVVGFMFRSSPNQPSETQVAMILKDHPAWQAGRLNGIGGKIDAAETPLNAMVREFAEESGSETKPDDWREFCLMTGSDRPNMEGWEIHYFVCLTGDGKTITSKESEKVGWYPLWQLEGKASDPRLVVHVIPNCKWLIPLALDKDHVFATIHDESSF